MQLGANIAYSIGNHPKNDWFVFSLAEGKAEMELSLWNLLWNRFGAFAESFFRETCRFSADMKQNDIPLAHILLSIYSKCI